MNRLDVQMLQNQIENLGDSALQRRKLGFEHDTTMQRLALDEEMKKIQEARAEAQTSHYNKMEDAQKGYFDRQDLRAQQQQQTEAMKEKQKLFESAAVLNSTGQLPDDARDQFNDFLANDEHFGATGLQLGKPDPRFTKNGNGPTAIQKALSNAQDYRTQASQAEDPDEAKRLSDYADMTESWVKKQGQFAPLKVPPTKNEMIQYDRGGHATNRVTNFTPPPTAPAPIPGGGGLPLPQTGAQPPSGAAGMVGVIRPDGTAGQIPSTNLTKALQMGYKQQ